MNQLPSPRALRAPLLVVLSGLLTALHPLAAQQDEPTWKREIKGTSWLKRLPSGTLMVGNASASIAADPITGKTLWERTDLGGLIKENVDALLPGVAVVNVPRKNAPTFRGMDLRDGHELWSVPGVSLGHWLVPSKQTVLTWNWRPADKMSAKEFGGRMMMINLADGKVLWEDANFFAKWPADREPANNLARLQAPAYDTDSTMVEFLTATGVRKWNLGTGKLIWEADLQQTGSSSPFYGYAPMLMDPAKRTLMVPIGTELAAIAVADGSIAMRTKLKGIARRMQFTDAGLLVMTGPETVGRVKKSGGGVTSFFVPKGTPKLVTLDGEAGITLIDPATGAAKWKKETRFGKGSSTFFVVRDQKAYYWNSERIMAVSLASGDEELFAQVPKFISQPWDLVAVDGGFLLRGETNVAFIDNAGKVTHHTSFRQPGLSMMMQLASSALSAGMDAAANNPNDVLGGMVRSGAVSVGDPDELRKLTTQTAHTDTRSIMYTKVKRGSREEKGFQLFDNRTGKMLGEVLTKELLDTPAFSDKQLQLVFDIDAGWMYYLEVINANRGTFGGWKIPGVP